MISGKCGQFVASLGDPRASVAEAFRLSRISEFTTPVDTEVWRRGYYDKPPVWESIGPQAGDVTELTKKIANQKAHKSSSMPFPKQSLEEKLSTYARALSKGAVKKRRQLRALRASAGGTSSSSSSSSSTSSSSTA